MKFNTQQGSENYKAKIIKITDYKKHPDADRLFIVSIDFNNVITGIEPKIGDLMVYFPVMSKINPDFLRQINAYSESTLNNDITVKGFFTSSGRVKPIKLRGIPSEGYMHPVADLEKFINTSISEKDLGQEFNFCNEILICEKYVIKTKEPNQHNKSDKSIVKISRLVDNQFRLHVDTDSLRKNVFKIKPTDIIGIHYKKHGTSFVVGNVLTKQIETWRHKLLKAVMWITGKQYVQDLKYDLIYSSRKVIKNSFISTNPNHYYNEDIWAKAKQELENKIPKGFTIYGEICGFTESGTAIQKDYDYGCNPGQHKIYAYRITFTNQDGFKVELTDKQIEEFCNKYDILYSDTFMYYGYAKDLFPKLDTESHWNENFLKELELAYTEKNCYICKNKVPEEGIVLRVENLFEYEAYKLKSFNFIKREDDQLESGESNLEDNQ